MNFGGRSTRAVMPVAGGAVLVVAGGALATVAEAVPAAPEAGDSLGALGGAPGTFESCEAYFGFGKELVAFGVVDQNGAHGVAHAVPTDTQVVFVVENEEGDQIECTPVGLTEEDWADLADDFPGIGAYPGANHFVYPSIEQGEFIEEDDFGEVEFVGFRVVGVPGGHTLVSPTGTVELFQSQREGGSLLFFDDIDPRTLAHLEAAPAAEAEAADAAAADAWEAVIADCDDDNSSTLLDDPDVLAAVEALEDLVGNDIGDDFDCISLGELNLDASIVLGVQASVAYLETITVALPVQATSTTVATTSTTVAVSPSSAVVLARTGSGRSSSVPIALVGAASIAGGALVLRARRRLPGSR